VIVSDVLAKHELEKLGLAHARLTDDVQVPASIYTLNTKDKFLLFERSYIIRPTNKRSLLGIYLPKDWQFWWWWMAARRAEYWRFGFYAWTK